MPPIKKEAKYRKPTLRETGFIRLRDGIWEHIRDARITPHDWAVYTTLHKYAKWTTGICLTSAGSISAAWGADGSELKKETVKKCLVRLRDRGYIKYPEGTGGRGLYPVLIDKYQPPVGPLVGWALDAAATGDYINPMYQYVSSVPFSEAYGAYPGVSPVRLQCVPGDPFSVSLVRVGYRLPLQDVIKMHQDRHEDGNEEGSRRVLDSSSDSAGNPNASRSYTPPERPDDLYRLSPAQWKEFISRLESERRCPFCKEGMTGCECDYSYCPICASRIEGMFDATTNHYNCKPFIMEDDDEAA